MPLFCVSAIPFAQTSSNSQSNDKRCVISIYQAPGQCERRYIYIYHGIVIKHELTFPALDVDVSLDSLLLVAEIPTFPYCEDYWGNGGCWSKGIEIRWYHARKRYMYCYSLISCTMRRSLLRRHTTGASLPRVYNPSNLSQQVTKFFWWWWWFLFRFLKAISTLNP